MTVIYTQKNCPACDALKDMLKQNKIEFTEETNIDLMLSLGITRTPMLHVDGFPEPLTQKQAIDWINSKK